MADASILKRARARLTRLLKADVVHSAEGPTQSTRFVTSLYEDLLRRAPTSDELAHWVLHLQTCSTTEVYFSFVNSGEFRRLHPPIRLFVPPGHYYSPIVDPAEIARRAATVFAIDRELPGIDLREVQQLQLLAELRAPYQRLPFRDNRQPDLRYHYNNESFGAGDAIILACMILAGRPRRIIEIGSGYSSAVILDIVERELMGWTRCEFIEPYPALFKSLLKPGDLDRCQLVASPVQLVDLSRFDGLKAGDILFIDSTHVVKTDSDVLHEVTQILPRLRPGVLIHFHDIFYPFEYPRTWIIDNNQSWNELYYLQAFLTNNSEYEIVLFNDYLGKKHGPNLAHAMPDMMKNPGGSLWLRKRGPDRISA